MSNVNTVVIVGNLTRDPELKYSQGGTAICTLRIAVNERAKDQSGEWGERANYFNVTVFGGQGERAAEWLTKGRQVAVEGRLHWEEWTTNDGQRRETVSIIANNVQFIGKRDDAQPQSQQKAPEHTVKKADGYAPKPAEDVFPDDDDDDVPF